MEKDYNQGLSQEAVCRDDSTSQIHGIDLKTDKLCQSFI